jgi:hypothetical protein
MFMKNINMWRNYYTSGTTNSGLVISGIPSTYNATANPVYLMKVDDGKSIIKPYNGSGSGGRSPRLGACNCSRMKRPGLASG